MRAVRTGIGQHGLSSLRSGGESAPPMLDRRGFILAAAPGLMAAARRTFYIAPNGSGDGSRWTRAAPLRALDVLIARAGPGGEVLLATDQGPYTDAENIALRSGGAAGAPVTIRGAGDAPALLIGSRAATFTPEAEKGGEGFRLLRGANHLRFTHLSFRDFGNGCFRIAGPVRDLTIADCSFFNVYRFIENTAAGRGEDASVTDFRIERCTGARIERSFLRIRYASARGWIEACRADSEAVEGDPFAVGCALQGQARAIAFIDCTMENFRHSRDDGYWNGDGFSDERGCADIAYIRCAARGCTDGGFDCKSETVRLVRCLAEDNKRNFRIWSGQAVLEHCSSVSPHARGGERDTGGPAHLWVGGTGAPEVSLLGFSAQSDAPAPLTLIDSASAAVAFTGPRLHLPDDAPRVQAAHPERVRVTIDGVVQGPYQDQQRENGMGETHTDAERGTDP